MSCKTVSQSYDSGSSTDLLATDTARSSDDLVLEADDEKGPLLRLPAPPIKPRKGLRGEADPSIAVTPGISPLPSPQRERTGFTFKLKTTEDVQQSQISTDDIYARYAKRRRREVLRRVTETVLLLILGLLSALQPSDGCKNGRSRCAPGEELSPC